MFSPIGIFRKNVESYLCRDVQRLVFNRPVVGRSYKHFVLLIGIETARDSMGLLFTNIGF